MALVQGEDTESDEEINTEHLQSLVLTPDGSLTGPGYRSLVKAKTAGIVMGEESETDEEDNSSVDQPDGGQDQSKELSESGSISSQETSRELHQEIVISEPQSLLHKKLREKNQSLRHNIVDRIIKLYRITWRNLTLVNNNLSKAQGTIETVNSNLKRTEHDLSELNSMIMDINTDAGATAPHLSITVPQATKKSPSPIRHKLFKNVPKVYNILGAVPSKLSSSAPSSSATPPAESKKGGKSQLTVPEAKPEGQSVESSGSSDTGPKVPEAQPAAPV